MSSNTRQKLIEYVAQKGSATGPELARHLGVTRQAVSLHLRQLIDDGEIVKTGSTKAARYFPPTAARPLRTVARDLRINGLDESIVYEEISVTLSLSRLSDSIESIVHYAFTEMLNNAIDHSMSDHCRIEAGLDAGQISFSVRDKGIGVFHSIAHKFGLQSEHDAMIELVKGKTTTKPEAHSGEGIFFVSRVADRFKLRSHRLQIEWDKRRDDVFVSEPRFLTGTLVSFEIGRHSRTKLENVFAEFAPEEYDYRFEKTRVLVKLLRREYVSRSEAKRLLHNLDRFSEIELDMRDVISVGQGFADEVFRVFASAHPDISIRAINAGDAVRAMIRHVAR
jgi:anti-sigma regulatory factor (Ser/Thr protein kinase)/biotin operon repressor